MDVSTTAAVFMILGGLVGVVFLLRAIDRTEPTGAAPELVRATKKLRAASAALERKRRHRHERVAAWEVREAIDSIAHCTRLLRRTANDSHVAALASIEKNVVLLSSVMDRLTASGGSASAGNSRVSRSS